MERRALLAAVLCLIILVGYQEALRYFYPLPPEAITAPGSDEPTSAASPPPSRDVAAAPLPPPSAPAVQGEPIVVDTELLVARIAPVGGRITSLRLKKYRTAVSSDSEPLEMIQVAPGAAVPLGVRLASEDGRVVEDDTQVAYSSDRQEVSLGGSETATLVLRGTLPSGATIEKRLTFAATSYPIELEIRTSGFPEQLSRIGVGWRHQISEAIQGDPELHYRGTLVLEDKKVVRDLATSLAASPPKVFGSPVGWVGYADHYFVAALIPAEPAQARAVVSPEAGGVQLLLTSPRASATEGSTRFTVYVGPKDVEVLVGAGHQLERAVDFGWFSFLAIPLLRLLKAFHAVTRNYGIDVILLTILVKVLFIPLTNRSMKSMRDMQRLQPQMAKLREKFKDDRERLNKEMIELYRRHRVNPLGGCLPMLLQFPVFIGLYQALSQAIELRHAKFAFWVRDLSAHECYPWPGQGTISGCNDFSMFGIPIPILVLLMGGSMILQQYLSPSTGMDPAQQRMMMILMPVMFTVMFINFPSGLVLYWLVNNVLTIAQQWWSNREPSKTATQPA
jgi:YidC/Oxa1 family membrane protein insertase